MKFIESFDFSEKALIWDIKFKHLLDIHLILKALSLIKLLHELNKLVMLIRKRALRVRGVCIDDINDYLNFLKDVSLNAILGTNLAGVRAGSIAELANIITHTAWNFTHGTEGWLMKDDNNKSNKSSLIPMPLPFLLTRWALRKHIIRNYGIWFWYFKWNKLHPGAKELARKEAAETDAPVFEQKEFSRALAPVNRLDAGQKIREYIDTKDIGVLQEISQMFAASLIGNKASVRFIEDHRPAGMSKADWNKSQMRKNIIDGMAYAGILKQILKTKYQRLNFSALAEAIVDNIPWEFNKDEKKRMHIIQSITKILISDRVTLAGINFDGLMDIAIHTAWNLTHGPDAWLMKGDN